MSQESERRRKEYSLESNEVTMISLVSDFVGLSFADANGKLVMS